MEVPSWKQQLAVASYLAVLAGLVTRLLVPAYVLAPGLPADAAFNIAASAVVGAFFLPFLWWRTTVGYIAAILWAILITWLWTRALALVTDGTLPAHSYLLVIPGFLFALLLIAGSVLAWREGTRREQTPTAEGNLRRHDEG